MTTIDTRPDSDVGEQEHSGTTDERLPKLAIGSTIPDTRLQIVRWLGQGGMGVVFEVRHLDIERRYAAKLLNVAKSPARMQRFRNEARTISRIGSPWIVEIFDFKELSDGRLMYLMELVEGPSLYSLVREHGPLPLPRLLGLARQVCKGLHDAHTRGFVHRDVKPENIMLGTDADGREQVKLVDFGLAALLDGPSVSTTSGTPAYMSPEQCQGLDTDVRSDIYSLGVTLYELACGQLPFAAEDEGTLRAAHLGDIATPPSSLLRRLPAAFDRVVARCLAKDPDQRYPSAAELEAALLELQLELSLRTVADHLPAPQLSDERRTRRLDDGLAALRNAEQQAERRRVVVGAVLSLAIVLAAGVGWQLESHERAAEIAEGQRELERLAARAREAAAHARWVYPTSAEPTAETAYRILGELEDVELPGARELGRSLREEFASTLVGLGDAYWDRAGGREFAKEFYAQALIFEPDHAHALRHVELTPLMLLELIDRASRAEFSPAQLAMLDPLASLAEPDPDARMHKLGAVREHQQLPPRTAAALDLLIAELGGPPAREDVPPELSRGHTGNGSGATLDDETEADDERETEADVEPEVEPAPEPASQPEPPRESEPSTTSTLASARAAYDSGRDDEATRLYQQLLARDRNNLDALVGLYRIAFDHGDFREALAYARRAAQLRPKRADLRLGVGDACMKVLDYACARSHYEAAAQLGDRQAPKRLELLDARIGGVN